jgi:hypothetical protein
MTGTSRNRRVECDLYLPGHCVHWIQARKASETTPRTGRLVEINDGVISVEYLDKIGRYRNHHPEDLLEVAQPGAKVRAFEGFGLPGVDINHFTTRMFCIADADRPWTPCSTEPMTSVTPEALAQRLQERGGFIVPGGAGQ